MFFPTFDMESLFDIAQTGEPVQGMDYVGGRSSAEVRRED
jgi:hypothetical protein